LRFHILTLRIVIQIMDTLITVILLITMERHMATDIMEGHITVIVTDRIHTEGTDGMVIIAAIRHITAGTAITGIIGDDAFSGDTGYRQCTCSMKKMNLYY